MARFHSNKLELSFRNTRYYPANRSVIIVRCATETLTMLTIVGPASNACKKAGQLCHHGKRGRPETNPNQSVHVGRACSAALYFRRGENLRV
jgi:hypothetical protein